MQANKLLMQSPDRWGTVSMHRSFAAISAGQFLPIRFTRC